MAVKIKLTDRQQKLAAGELDTERDNAESLRDAGFDFVDDERDTGEPDVSDTEAGPEQSGEYIDEVDPGDADDGSVVESGVLDSGDDGSDLPDWIDDRVRDYASSYGLTDEDLSNFGSFEQLQRFGRVVDARFAAGSSASEGEESSTDTASSGDGTQSQAGSSSQRSSSEDSQDGVLGRLKPLDRKRYEEANYGDAELDLVDQLNATIEAVRQFVPSIAKQMESQQEQEFHRALDELDPTLYGKAFDGDKFTGSLSPAFEENRRSVRETMGLLRRGIIRDAVSRGIPEDQVQVPSLGVLAQRAAAIVEHDRKANTSNTSNIAAQSRRRRPVGTGGTRRSGGTGKSASNSTGTPDEVKQILSSPEISRFWKQAQRENGVT